MLNKLIRFLSHFSHCIMCGYASRSSVCEACHKSLPILTHYCRICAQNLPLGDNQHVCGNCLSQPPPYDQVYALFPYRQPVSQLIVQLKFHHQLTNARLFAEVMEQKIRYEWYANSSFPELILPVPLHRKRLQERGFNQALEIAKPISKAFQLPIETNNVARVRDTAAQSSLSSSERKENVARAFATNHNFNGQHIAIIDDVMTTGHTVSALSHLLRQKGARRIDIWCCARCDIAESSNSLYISKP